MELRPSPLTMPKNGHLVVLTRFCNRSFGASSGAHADLSVDPLSDENLQVRIRLLESICARGIGQQTIQNFDWIIIVDPDLPAPYLDRVKHLASTRKRTYVRVYPEQYHLYSLDWCRESIPKETEWLVTINLDDDDVLPPDYVEKTLSLLRTHTAQERPLVYRVFGISNSVFWDILLTRWAQLGYISPYHRAAPFPSCGFGLISNYPTMNYNVLGLTHSNPHWYATGSQKPLFKFQPFSQEIDRLESLGALSKQDLGKPGYLHFLATDSPAIMTNHRINVQWCRVLEFKPGMRLAKRSDLEPYGVDPDQVLQHREWLKLSPERLLRFYCWKPYQLAANVLTFPLVLLRTLLRRA